MRTFEYDEAKSLSNAQKHGIDFLAAQAIWDDPDAIEVQAKSYDEERFVVIGRIAGKHWSAVRNLLLILRMRLVLRNALLEMLT